MTNLTLLKLLNNAGVRLSDSNFEAAVAEMRKQMVKNFEIAFKTPSILEKKK